MELDEGAPGPYEFDPNSDLHSDHNPSDKDVVLVFDILGIPLDLMENSWQSIREIVMKAKKEWTRKHAHPLKHSEEYTPNYNRVAQVCLKLYKLCDIIEIYTVKVVKKLEI